MARINLFPELESSYNSYRMMAILIKVPSPITRPSLRRILAALHSDYSFLVLHVHHHFPSHWSIFFFFFLIGNPDPRLSIARRGHRRRTLKFRKCPMITAD